MHSGCKPSSTFCCGVIRFAVPIIMLAQMVKGQSPQERSLLRRELPISNYTSCCCWTFLLLLLSHCCCVILKSTDSASDMGLAVWKSKTHCKVWQLMVSETCAADQPWRQQAVNTPNPLGESWEPWALPEGSVTAILHPPCWNRAHASGTFHCPGSLSCRQRKHGLHRASFPTGQCCRDTESAAGLGQAPLPPCVHTGSVPCSARVQGWLKAAGEHREQPCNAAQLPQQRRVNLRGTCKEMQLSEPSASQSVWRTQCATAKSFCAGSCTSFNCNCFKILSSLEIWGPTH